MTTQHLSPLTMLLSRHTRRREFITLIGGAAAWPLAARTQQAAMPVIGVLDARSPGTTENLLRAFRQGLKETGYVEGENVALEYRWADNQIDRLPVLAAELVRRQVSIIAGSTPAVALAAQQATTAVPIVFLVNEDPVGLGLVASLARPGGNATGINIFTAELTAKRLDLLRELVPGAAHVGVLVNPANATSAESTLRDMAAAARTAGLQIKVVLNASNSLEIEAAFASLLRERPDALFVATDAYFFTRRVQLSHLATRHKIASTYSQREFDEAGGLMSYGTSLTDAYRQIGVYAGRILKGAKPAELPVVQSSKFELVINVSTARMLGLTVPDKLLVAADEVIE
jgi:putative ABC transport system substrate-binding protein